MKRFDLEIMVVIVVVGIIAALGSISIIYNIMGVLIRDIGFVPVMGIIIGFAGLYYGTSKVEKVFSNGRD